MEDYISDYFDEQLNDIERCEEEEAKLRFELMFESNVDCAALSAAIQNIEYPRITLLSATPIETTVDMTEMLRLLKPIDNNETKN